MMNRIVSGVLFVLLAVAIWQLDRRRQHEHGFAMGKASVQAVWEKAVREQQHKALQISVEADRSQLQAQEKIRTIYETITKESIRYVQSHPDTCNLDVDWLRIHDAAASGNIDPATSSPDGAS